MHTSCPDSGSAEVSVILCVDFISSERLNNLSKV